MSLILSNSPVADPVSLAEVRLQCNLAADDTSHDDRLNLNISAATRMVERITKRALITQGYVLNTVPRTMIELPRPPLQSVTSVHVLDTDGNYALVAASDYQVSANDNPGSIRMIESWPSWNEYEPEPVKITYVAGFGDTSSDVPDDLRLAVLQVCAFLFEHPGDGMSEQNLPFHLIAMLQGLRSGTGGGFFKGVV